jgi:hypothetical protein
MLRGFFFREFDSIHTRLIFERNGAQETFESQDKIATRNVDSRVTSQRVCGLAGKLSSELLTRVLLREVGEIARPCDELAAPRGQVVARSLEQVFGLRPAALSRGRLGAGQPEHHKRRDEEGRHRADLKGKRHPELEPAERHPLNLMSSTG